MVLVPKNVLIAQNSITMKPEFQMTQAKQFLLSEAPKNAPGFGIGLLWSHNLGHPKSPILLFLWKWQWPPVFGQIQSSAKIEEKCRSGPIQFNSQRDWRSGRRGQLGCGNTNSQVRSCLPDLHFRVFAGSSSRLFCSLGSSHRFIRLPTNYSTGERSND